jgi:hypothetical protein
VTTTLGLPAAARCAFASSGFKFVFSALSWAQPPGVAHRQGAELGLPAVERGLAMPCQRHTSTAAAPAAASLKMPMICSSPEAIPLHGESSCHHSYQENSPPAWIDSRREAHGDQGHVCEQGDSAHRLQRHDGGRHGPSRHELLDLAPQASDPRRGVLDGADVVLQDDLLGGMVEAQVGKPAPMRPRPSAAAMNRRCRSKKACSGCRKT